MVFTFEKYPIPFAWINTNLKTLENNRLLVDSGVFTVKHEKIMICFLICEYFHQKYWPGKVVLEFDEWIKWSGEKHLQLRLQNNF